MGSYMRKYIGGRFEFWKAHRLSWDLPLFSSVPSDIAGTVRLLKSRLVN
jgi:hypothetical protein